MRVHRGRHAASTLRRKLSMSVSGVIVPLQRDNPQAETNVMDLLPPGDCRTSIVITRFGSSTQ